MADEVASLSVRIDGLQQQTVDLNALAVAGTKADTALGAVAHAAKAAGGAVDTAKFNQARAALLALGTSAADVETALKKTAQQFVTMNPAAVAAANSITQVSTAATGAATALGSGTGVSGLTSATTGAAKGFGALARPLTSFLDHMVGAPPIVGAFSRVLGNFALGTGATVGILAGLTAVAFAFQKITESSRASAKAAEDAAKSFKEAAKTRADPLSAFTGQYNALARELPGAEARDRVLRSGLPGPLADVVGYFSGKQLRTLREGLSNAPFAREDAQNESLSSRTRAVRQALDFDPSNPAIKATARALLTELHAGVRAAGGASTAEGRELLGDIGDLTDKDASAADRAAKAAARDAKRAEEAARRLAEKIAKETPRRQAAPFGSLSNIESRGGTDLVDAIEQATRDTQYANGAQERLLGGFKLRATVEGGLNSGLKFGGSAQALKDLEGFKNLRDNLSVALSDSLTSGIAGGFETFFKTGSVSDGFKALAGGLLNGLGDAAISFGTASLALAPIMQAIRTAFASLNPAAAVAGSVALVGLGAALKAAASKMFSSGGSGSGLSAYSGGGVATTTGLYGGDINSRGVVPGAVGGSPSIPSVGGMGQPNNLPPMHFSIIGPNDPTAQRQIATLVRNAVARGVQGFSGSPGYAGASAG